MRTLTLTHTAGGHDVGSTITTTEGAAATLVALGYAQVIESDDKPKRGRPSKATKPEDDAKVDTESE